MLIRVRRKLNKKLNKEHERKIRGVEDPIGELIQNAPPLKAENPAGKFLIEFVPR